MDFSLSGQQGSFIAASHIIFRDYILVFTDTWLDNSWRSKLIKSCLDCFDRLGDEGKLRLKTFDCLCKQTSGNRHTTKQGNEALEGGDRKRDEVGGERERGKKEVNSRIFHCWRPSLQPHLQ